MMAGVFASRALTFGPPPSSYEEVAIERPGPPPAEFVEAGRCCWLSDSQTDLTGEHCASTSRLVQEVVTADALRDAAAFEIVFSPDFQRVIIHHVRVIRNNEVRELATPEAFELLRRERDLERAMYDGRLTAHMLLPDVRVGDIIDTAFTLIGDNPALRGVFGADVHFQWSVPVVHTRVRLLAPKSRQFTTRAWGPAVEHDEIEQGESVERTWSARNTPAYRSEPNAPPWWVGFSMLRIADALAWADVADLFREAYDQSGPLPTMLEQAARVWEGQGLEPEELAFRALTFVQSELRYHAIGIGVGGFLPRPLEEICATRFGDCKDASRALVALLRRLSLDACPALVNVFAGEDLGGGAPWPTAFNHCIVRLHLAGETYWLDPSQSAQSGGLKHLTQACYGWALPLIEGAELTRMSERPILTIYESREDWRFGADPADPVEAEMRTVFRGWRADEYRRRLANDGEAVLARQFREYAEAAYGEAEVAEPLSIRDRPEQNEFEVVRAYRFARLAEKGNGRYSASDDVVGPNLSVHETPRRTAPIDLGLPRRCISERRFTFPPHIRAKGWKDVFEAPGFVGRSELVVDPDDGSGTLVLEIEVTRRIVTAEEAAVFFEAARKFHDRNGVSFNLTPPPVAAKSTPAKKPGPFAGVPAWRWAWLLLVLGAMFARVLSGH